MSMEVFDVLSPDERHEIITHMITYNRCDEIPCNKCPMQISFRTCGFINEDIKNFKEFLSNFISSDELFEILIGGGK
jgi:hypothetical protein